MSRYPIVAGSVPYVTTDQMREVDRAMIEDYQIELVQMMENAGRNLAHLARHRFLGGDPRDTSVIVLAGPGGNGGGALVCARRLHGYGATVQVLISAAEVDFAPIPSRQLAALRYLPVPRSRAVPKPHSPQPDLVIDGMLGYSLRGAPREPAAAFIRWANATDTPILALDAPSGVDSTTGEVFDPAIRATATMTLALPKVGLRMPGARDYVGELYLADIGVPPELYAQPGLDIRVGHIFSKSDIIRLR